MAIITQSFTNAKPVSKIGVVLTLLIIILSAIRFALAPAPVPAPGPAKIRCRSLFEQLDCSLHFGFRAVDWGGI